MTAKPQQQGSHKSPGNTTLFRQIWLAGYGLGLLFSALYLLFRYFLLIEVFNLPALYRLAMASYLASFGVSVVRGVLRTRLVALFMDPLQALTIDSLPYAILCFVSIIASPCPYLLLPLGIYAACHLSSTSNAFSNILGSRQPMLLELASHMELMSLLSIALAFLFSRGSLVLFLFYPLWLRWQHGQNFRIRNAVEMWHQGILWAVSREECPVVLKSILLRFVSMISLFGERTRFLGRHATSSQ